MLNTQQSMPQTHKRFHTQVHAYGQYRVSNSPSLHAARKLKHPEETHTETGRACKDSANFCRWNGSNNTLTVWLWLSILCLRQFGAIRRLKTEEKMIWNLLALLPSFYYNQLYCVNLNHYEVVRWKPVLTTLLIGWIWPTDFSNPFIIQTKQQKKCVKWAYGCLDAFLRCDVCVCVCLDCSIMYVWFHFRWNWTPAQCFPFAEGKPLRDDEVLQSLPVGTTATMYFRDLGPQLGWTMVRRIPCKYSKWRKHSWRKMH